MQLLKLTWGKCIKKGKECLSQMKKQSNGGEKPQNKDLQMRN
uniref:Uncharacterized protein n=1 Tax=Plectus sambesii TaxID=2011161 RepID=A0A914UM99_9BILA